ncbi:MAG TPA: hypothetical protein VGO24_05795 [Solirubrobacterales bacterium]|nr:hypothetical protein [Solirubrobacterales bacterium]
MLAVAVFVVGCGGGGGGTSSGTSAGGTGATTTNASSGDGGSGGSGSNAKPLTKKEFITKGDAICAEIPPEYEAKRQQLILKSKNKATTSEINLKAAVPPIYVAVENMEKLGPPTGEEAEVEAIIAALEAAGKGLEKEPSAPLTGPKSPYAEFQKLTKEYGFKFCNEL